jgi:hypothetical protein
MCLQQCYMGVHSLRWDVHHAHFPCFQDEETQCGTFPHVTLLGKFGKAQDGNQMGPSLQQKQKISKKQWGHLHTQGWIALANPSNGGYRLQETPKTS